MSRFVVLRRSGLVAVGEAGPPDKFLQRLTKYVPGDFIVFYSTTIGGLVVFFPIPTPESQCYAFALLFIFSLSVAVYFWRKAPKGEVRLLHVILSPLAFAALAYPIAAPLLGYWFQGKVSLTLQALLILATMVWFQRRLINNDDARTSSFH